MSPEYRRIFGQGDIIYFPLLHIDLIRPACGGPPSPEGKAFGSVLLCLPLWGRWQREALTDEVASSKVNDVALHIWLDNDPMRVV